MGIFGNKQESSNTGSTVSSISTSSKSKSSFDAGNQINMIGKGAKIEGTLNVAGDVRVGGQIVGEVNVEKKLMVTAEGRVDANIQAGDADIAGRIKGDVVAKGSLTLRSTCVLEGNIKCTRLMIEEGAIYKGRCEMRSPLTQAGKSGGSELKAVNK